ncbi:MAG: sugar-binding transcriptional regulator [Paracoccaceae bacterium]|nr:sugar-binding transcriptional regulator [Paracoccaceae bacterium]
MRDGSDDLLKAAWLYHIGQMSQEEVSRRMGLSRFKVLRLLAEARDLGLIRISIEHETVTTLTLADRLTDRFALTEALVAPDPGEGDVAARRAVGHLAASFLARIAREGPMTVGVGWGRTLAAMAGALTGLRNPDLCFVSLMGSMTHTSATSPFDVCVRLAALTGGRAVFLPAPFLADTPADAALIMGQRMVRAALDVAQSATHMVISVGECTPDALLQTSGVLTAAEVAGLATAQAVGDTTGKFFCADGQLADTDLNTRAPAIGLDDLHHADVVLLAAGRGKAQATQAVLRAGFVNRLIVDQSLATALLQGDQA